MSEAVRLPGETPRLRALTLLHSTNHSMASQCCHSTHMRLILNASPVKSSPKASRTCSHNPLRCVLLARVGVMPHTAAATLLTACISNAVLSHRSIRAPGRYCFLWRLWHASARGGTAALLLPAVLQLSEGFADDHACACSGHQPLHPCLPELD